MTLQISQRGKEYLKTAQTLLRTAKTMTDQAIAAQLKALADDYERRAERATLDDAARALARSAERWIRVAYMSWWAASLSSYRADQRSNFGRKSTRASEGSELCQRAKALVYPARILQKKGLFRFQDWD
jgi:hypothetical protein